MLYAINISSRILYELNIIIIIYRVDIYRHFYSLKLCERSNTNIRSIVSCSPEQPLFYSVFQQEIDYYHRRWRDSIRGWLVIKWKTNPIIRLSLQQRDNWWWGRNLLEMKKRNMTKGYNAKRGSYKYLHSMAVRFKEKSNDAKFG